jgi:uncharacterized protein
VAVETGVQSEAIREVAVPVRATGDPQVLGWLVFVVGSTCLGLELVGYVPQAVLGAPLAIIFGATGLGLLVSTIWAAYLGQTFVAGAFGTFAGFWFSYTTLVLGLQHNWFLIPAEAVQRTVVGFLIAWAIAVFLLTIATVRLPSLYTIDVALVDAALWILVVANNSGSTGLTKVAGLVVFAFAALGAYIWLSSADTSLGGPGYPLGRPMRQ